MPGFPEVMTRPKGRLRCSVGIRGWRAPLRKADELHWRVLCYRDDMLGPEALMCRQPWNKRFGATVDQLVICPSASRACRCMIVPSAAAVTLPLEPVCCLRPCIVGATVIAS